MSLDDRVPPGPPDYTPNPIEVRARSEGLFTRIGHGSWVVYDYTLTEPHPAQGEDRRSSPRKAAILEVYVAEDGRLVLETVSTIVSLPPGDNAAENVTQILNPDGSELWSAP